MTLITVPSAYPENHAEPDLGDLSRHFEIVSITGNRIAGRIRDPLADNISAWSLCSRRLDCLPTWSAARTGTR